MKEWDFFVTLFWNLNLLALFFYHRDYNASRSLFYARGYLRSTDTLNRQSSLFRVL